MSQIVTFRVILVGEQPGYVAPDGSTMALRLQGSLGLDAATAASYVQAAPVMIWNGLGSPEAQQCAEFLQAIGGVAHIEDEAVAPMATLHAPPEEVNPAAMQTGYEDDAPLGTLEMPSLMALSEAIEQTSTPHEEPPPAQLPADALMPVAEQPAAYAQAAAPQPDESTCPKCGFPRAPGAPSCAQCGVIFGRIRRASQPPEAAQSATDQVKDRASSALKSIKGRFGN